VAELEVAWTFDTGDWSDGSELPTRSAFEATPPVIDGVLYVPSVLSRLFALDAEPGTPIPGFGKAALRKPLLLISIPHQSAIARPGQLASKSSAGSGAAPSCTFTVCRISRPGTEIT
jgi:hypothetical protein